MDIKYMQRAIELAKLGEGFTNPNPLVGAVIVKDGRIIGEGWHECYGGLHAERNALKNATEPVVGADMYVTLEPCPMCAGAISNAHLERVVFGASDFKAGALGTVFNLNDYPVFKPEVVGGVLGEECATMLTDFFKTKRKK